MMNTQRRTLCIFMVKMALFCQPYENRPLCVTESTHCIQFVGDKFSLGTDMSSNL